MDASKRCRGGNSFKVSHISYGTFQKVLFTLGKLARLHHHPFTLVGVVLPPREALLREALNPKF